MTDKEWRNIQTALLSKITKTRNTLLLGVDLATKLQIKRDIVELERELATHRLNYHVLVS